MPRYRVAHVIGQASRFSLKNQQHRGGILYMAWLPFPSKAPSLLGNAMILHDMIRVQAQPRNTRTPVSNAPCLTPRDALSFSSETTPPTPHSYFPFLIVESPVLEVNPRVNPPPKPLPSVVIFEPANGFRLISSSATAASLSCLA